MKLDKVANSGNDEFYTPRYAVLPIIKYLKQKNFKNVWCPFDTSDSLFVKLLQKSGFNVTYTHLDTGGDFFKLIINDDFTAKFDVIVSNPPYSLKTEVLYNLFRTNKPFAMLLGVVGLFESKKRFEMFRDNEFEIMYFNKRISYFENYTDEKPSRNPPFSSVYVTRDLLPKQIVFEEIDKKVL